MKYILITLAFMFAMMSIVNAILHKYPYEIWFIFLASIMIQLIPIIKEFKDDDNKL